MRYIPVTGLKENMTLGQDVYDGAGRVLLAKDQILTSDLIANMQKIGLQGAYIEDDFSSDIEIDEVIRPEMRSNALKIIHNLFEKEAGSEDSEEWQIRKLVIDVVDDVLSRGDVMYNMMDLKTYDNYTYFHSVNVGILSAVLGARYGLEEQELRMLTAAAFMHDIGKRFLEEGILNAKRPLSEIERHIMLQHPKLGYEFLRDNYDFPQEVQQGVLEHHECYNGEGYPLRKSGEEISIYARIIKIADVYDAMVSKRPYRDVLPPSDAVEYIMAMCGSEFDSQLVDLFIKWVAVYPVGCEVILSDGRHAVVMKNFPNFVLRPIVKVMDTGEVLNLNEDRDTQNITIVETVV